MSIENSDNPIDMETVRTNVVQRVLDKLALIKDLQEVIERLAASADKASLINPGRRHIGADVNGLSNHTDMLKSSVEDDLHLDISQLGFLIARDVIVDTVRRGTATLRRDPIVWLTGNSYVPSYRSLDDVEAVWQADDEGSYVEALWERVTEVCSEMEVYITEPEFDNALYGVDLKVFKANDDPDVPEDDLNDQWIRITDE